MALSLILKFWRELLIALLLGWVVLLKMNINNLTEDLNKIRTISGIAREQSDAELKILREAFPFVVDYSEKRGWANAKSRFGTCAPAGSGIRADGLLPAFSGGEAPVAQSDGGTKPEFVAVDRPFIATCAEDAGYRNLVIEACHRNPLICEFK